MHILTVIPKMYHIHFLKNIEIKDKLSFIPHNNVLRYIVSKVNSSVIVNGALGLRALKPKPPPRPTLFPLRWCTGLGRPGILPQQHQPYAVVPDSEA